MPRYVVREFDASDAIGPTGLILEPDNHSYRWAWCPDIGTKRRWEPADCLPLLTVDRTWILRNGLHQTSLNAQFHQARRDELGPLFIYTAILVASPTLFSVAIRYRHVGQAGIITMHYKISDRKIRTVFWTDLPPDEKALITKALDLPHLQHLRGSPDFTRRHGKLCYHYPVPGTGK